ncbi:hypothetical protein [Erwinia tasmaniensis]|uniref:hypothetical protein n=1 Tax=Erwinia tasmaniensis TaxID=338565 RepID=UPI003A4D992C
MTDKQYPSNLYLESAATNVDFAKQVPVEAVIVMAKELLSLRNAPDGWKLVPVEPTEEMVISGFESQPDECLSDPVVWEKYSQMSGCQQASYEAQLCWAAMLAVAPCYGTK